jgi:hypothetical protein
MDVSETDNSPFDLAADAAVGICRRDVAAGGFIRLSAKGDDLAGRDGGGPVLPSPDLEVFPAD